MSIAQEIFLDNDFLVSLGPVTQKVRTTDTPTLATGLVVRCFIANTGARTATPIHADLDWTMTEQGSTAVYHLSIDGALITTRLAGFVDQKVWFHFVVDGDYRSACDTTVRAERPIGT